MSGLAALLAGHDEPGVYQWHNAARVDDVQHAVEKAGWSFAYLDGWTVEDRPSFLKSVGAALDSDSQPLAEDPDGAALSDALSGALADVHAGDSKGVVLLWDGWSPLCRADEPTFWNALDAFRQRCTDGHRDTFAVLLRGEGPEIDVPELPDGPH